MTGLSAQHEYVAKAYKPGEIRVEPEFSRIPRPEPVPQRMPSGSAFGTGQEQRFKMAEMTTGRSLSPAHAPVRIVLRLQAFWQLSDEDFLAMCGLPLEADQSPAQSLAKYLKLSDVQTRLRSLMSIRMRLSALLGADAAGERRWLNTRWARIDHKTPLSMMMSTNIGDVMRAEAAVREIAGA